MFPCASLHGALLLFPARCFYLSVLTVISFSSCELACLRFDVRRCLLIPQSELDIMMVKPGWNEVPSMRKNVRVLEVRFQNFRNLVIEMAIAKAGNVLRRWFGGKHVSVRAVCCSSGPILPTVVVLPAPFVSLA